MCCYKEDSEQTQSRILNIAFPDHSFFICFCVKAEQYSAESLEVYKLKKKQGEAKCFESVRQRVPTEDKHLLEKDGPFACDVCRF